MPTPFWGDDAQRARYGRFPRPSRAENSGLCGTPIPNRTFATPYVSRPFLSHARSRSAPGDSDGHAEVVIAA